MYKIQTFDATDDKMAEKVKEFLERTGGFRHFDPAKDSATIAVNDDGEVVGFFAGRPMPLIHEFRISDNCVKKSVAEGLFNYSMGAAFAVGHRECIMAVDKSNTAMLRFIGSTGAFEYSSGQDIVYILGLK